MFDGDWLTKIACGRHRFGTGSFSAAAADLMKTVATGKSLLARVVVFRC